MKIPPEYKSPVVAHFKDNFLPRSETFIYNLISGLKRYHSIVIDRYKQQNRERFPFGSHFSPSSKLGSPFGVLERGLLRFVKFSPYLEMILLRQRVNIIHAHFGQLGALITPVARRHNLPLFVSFYGMDEAVFGQDPQWQPYFTRLWEHAHVCLVLGPSMAVRLNALGCPSEKIHHLPLCIDTERFAFTARRIPSYGEPIQLLVVGRLVPKKGIDILLHALKRSSSKRKLVLTVVGDGPLRSELQSLARELQLNHRVRFVGWLENMLVARQMQSAHLFVLPSRTDPDSGDTEGTPTVLLEAQASGLPVISTNHADIPAIVKDGRTGWLVPESDAEALAAKLDEIANQPQIWAEFGRTARDYVENNHDRDIVGRRLEELYDRCLQ